RTEAGRRLRSREVLVSRDVRSRRLYIYRIERLAGGHEQAVALRAAEADVGADLRQQDHADAGPVRREHMDAVVARAHPAGADPDVPLDVRADAVGHTDVALARQFHTDE